MVPRILYLRPKTYKRLIPCASKQNETEPTELPSDCRPVVLNSEGRTSGELAHLLDLPRSRVSSG